VLLRFPESSERRAIHLVKLDGMARFLLGQSTCELFIIKLDKFEIMGRLNFNRGELEQHSLDYTDIQPTGRSA
jgi:hypothetical protein